MNCIDYDIVIFASQYLHCGDYFSLMMSCVAHYKWLKNSRDEICFTFRHAARSTHRLCKKYYAKQKSTPSSLVCALAKQQKKLWICPFTVPPISHLCNEVDDAAHEHFISECLRRLSIDKIAQILKESIKDRYIPHETCFMRFVQQHAHKNLIPWEYIAQLYFYFSPSLAKKVAIINFDNGPHKKHLFLQDEFIDYLINCGIQFSEFEDIKDCDSLHLGEIPLNATFIAQLQRTQRHTVTLTKAHKKYCDGTYLHYLCMKLNFTPYLLSDMLFLVGAMSYAEFEKYDVAHYDYFAEIEWKKYYKFISHLDLSITDNVAKIRLLMRTRYGEFFIAHMKKSDNNKLAEFQKLGLC